jgi:hypothetical protein
VLACTSRSAFAQMLALATLPVVSRMIACTSSLIFIAFASFLCVPVRLFLIEYYYKTISLSIAF